MTHLMGRTFVTFTQKMHTSLRDNDDTVRKQHTW